MKVTRILHAKRPNKGKRAARREQAKRLGQVRSEVWQRFGSLQGVGLSDRQIRDAWLGEGRAFPVSANAWKETLRDAKGNITANMEAAKVKARRCIWRHTQDQAEQKRLFTALKINDWTRDPYLRRVMRRYWVRGHNHTHNQLIVRSDNYTTFQLGGRAWIKIPGLTKGQRIALPLNSTRAPTGTLRLILKDDDRLEVHYTLDVDAKQNGGERTIGVDKGYSEVLVDADGEHHGPALGALLTDTSDKLKAKYQRRSKLRALANKTRNPRKREHIRRFNLGRKKLERQMDNAHARIRDTVFQAVHAVADKAARSVAVLRMRNGTSQSPFRLALGDNHWAPVRPAPGHGSVTTCPQGGGRTSPWPSVEWLDGVSDALASGLCGGGTSPLRHAGQTPAPTPTGDYRPSLRFPWPAAGDRCGRSHRPDGGQVLRQERHAQARRLDERRHCRSA
jgi:hypothetical protein